MNLSGDQLATAVVVGACHLGLLPFDQQRYRVIWRVTSPLDAEFDSEGIARAPGVVSARLEPIYEMEDL